MTLGLVADGGNVKNVDLLDVDLLLFLGVDLRSQRRVELSNAAVACAADRRSHGRNKDVCRKEEEVGAK